MEEWIKQGGFLAVIGILLIGTYYLKNKADQLTIMRNDDAKAYQAQQEKCRVEYVSLLQNVLQAVEKNTVAIDTVSRALDITLKLEKMTESLRSTK